MIMNKLIEEQRGLKVKQKMGQNRSNFELKAYKLWVEANSIEDFTELHLIAK